eukprot:280832-Amphidinium_carterae.1
MDGVACVFPVPRMLHYISKVGNGCYAEIIVACLDKWWQREQTVLPAPCYRLCSILLEKDGVVSGHVQECAANLSVMAMSVKQSTASLDIAYQCPLKETVAGGELQTGEWRCK